MGVGRGFSEFQCANQVDLQEVKLTKPPGPLGFVILCLVHTKLPAISQLWFRFSHAGMASCRGFCSAKL